MMAKGAITGEYSNRQVCHDCDKTVNCRLSVKVALGLRPIGARCGTGVDSRDGGSCFHTLPITLRKD